MKQQVADHAAHNVSPLSEKQALTRVQVSVQNFHKRLIIGGHIEKNLPRGHVEGVLLDLFHPTLLSEVLQRRVGPSRLLEMLY
jgi:hypothetical protein